MGVYNINIGKGVVVHLSTIYRKYKDEIKKYIEKYENGDLEIEFDNIGVEVMLTKIIGYPVSTFGHDAFQFRDGFFKTDLFDREDVLSQNTSPDLTDLVDDPIWIQISYIDPQNLFIGFYNVLEGEDSGEFGWYVKAPEVIYGIAGIIPDIIKFMSKDFNTTDLSNMFNQKDRIWTFTSDCLSLIHI